MFMSGILWILTKISILKAIHNSYGKDEKEAHLWILTKISILKAIHNFTCPIFSVCMPVNPH